jgi:hypothetical protein
MKKISVVFLSVFFVIISLSLAQISQAVERMTTKFTYGISVDADGNIIISFTPETKGKEGDGYAVNYWNSGALYPGYFLPENESLVLPNNKYFCLDVARAFKTKSGMVIGDSQTININPGLEAAMNDNLGLQNVDGIFSTINHISIVADYVKKNINIYTRYYGPPIHYDWIEVELSAYSYRDLIPSIYKKIYGGKGQIRLPRNRQKYETYCSARAVIEDGERIIVSSVVEIEYAK